MKNWTFCFWILQIGQRLPDMHCCTASCFITLGLAGYEMINRVRITELVMIISNGKLQVSDVRGTLPKFDIGKTLEK